MKDWFPLTSYDFYSYMAAGIIVIAGCDYFLADSILIDRAQWTVAQGFFWVVLCYLIGHILAGPSQLIIEELLTRRLFRPPSVVIVEAQTARLRERILRIVFSANDYRPLSYDEQVAIHSRALQKFNSGSVQPVQALSAEQIFFVAYPYAREVADSAARLDNFSALYGMSRNVCFSSLIVTILALCRCYGRPSGISVGIALAGTLLTIGLYGRFLKFYSTYSKEVYRTFYKATA